MDPSLNTELWYIPDWVGKIDGNVNYRGYLQSRGVYVPLIVDDGGSDVVDYFDSGSMDDPDPISVSVSDVDTVYLNRALL